MHRFFVSSEVLGQPPRNPAGAMLITLVGDQAHQVRRVLRMRPGDHVVLLDNRGWAYEAVLIAYGEADARFETISRWAVSSEPRVHITLYQAMLRGEHFAWALQKGTEVGISRFVPTVCERNVVSDLPSIERKRDRWVRVIQEAAEQSGRARLPELAPAQTFAAAVQAAASPGLGEPPPIRLILWEGVPAVSGTTLRQALLGVDRNLASGACIQVYVGPEGGLTAAEVGLAQSYGVQPVTLGARILRAETAGVVAAAIILYEAGDI